MRIYVVNNYGQYNHLIYRTLRDLGVETRLISNETLPENLEKIELDGLVIGGGPSVDRSGYSMEYIRNLDIPILGICLGHQLISMAFGGEVRRGEKGGFAEVEIRIVEENDLFHGFGERIRVWASHADEVSFMPEDFKLLATSDICEVEAMKHVTKPIYGVQWHPEVAHTEKGEETYRNFVLICKK